jgi:hypothetical protein
MVDQSRHILTIVVGALVVFIPMRLFLARHPRHFIDHGTWCDLRQIYLDLQRDGSATFT